MTCIVSIAGAGLHGLIKAPMALAGIASRLAFLGILAAPVLAATQVTVRLEGEIAPECAIGGGNGSHGGSALALPLEVGDITRPGRRDFGFLVNCNTPFHYRLEAQYGALANIAATPAPDGFTKLVPYDVAVHIPTDGPAIQDRCGGESIRAGRVSCPFSTSGNSIALDSAARLTISWQPQGKVPLAGAYVERLTVTVAASL
jgi:hypothetical protein